ncbi:hypothetical protein FZEAL_4870 [Fusarium zealandicum]|uniref:Uncharacterized protein n=1 Tax=Fusarium zealandicum TaxID=1053134 RepID=A0A8H4XL53_9HYPO|nr:hypothetical protein FZEAL_4870 [Fusarium zealandicum]
MEPTWQDTIDSIVEWVADDRFAAKCGHIQGPAATAKGIKVPLAIWKTLRDQSPDVHVVHVLADFKRSHVVECRTELEAGSQAADGLDLSSLRNFTTLTYHEFVDLFRETLIETDPEFSAEFALAFSVAFAYIMSFDGASADGTMRVMTMSWENIHPFARELFRYCEVYQEFELPEINRGQARIMSSPEESIPLALKTIRDLYASKNPDFRHMTVTFMDFKIDRSEWGNYNITSTNDLEILYQAKDHINPWILAPDGLRTPRNLPASNLVYIIPSGSSEERRIFDLETRQVVAVTLKTSTSERKQQLSWMDRTECARSGVTVIMPNGFIEGENAELPRRLEVLNSQLSGFILALTEFVDWPSAYMALMLHNFRRLVEHHVVADMTRRLVLSQILNVEDTPLGFSLNLPKEAHRNFYRVLPLLKYDGRAAHFLCAPSSSSFVVLIKMQAAVMLMTSFSSLFAFDSTVIEEAVEEIVSFAGQSINGNFARFGSFWMAKGLMMLVTKHTPKEPQPMDILRLPELGLTIDIVGLGEARATFNAIFHEFLENGVAVAHDRDSADGCGNRKVTEAEFEEVSLHLARAYTHQRALVTWDTDTGEMLMTDQLSKQPLCFETDTDRFIAWADIIKADGLSVVGVYSYAGRDPSTGMTTIQDWTWIPQKVWSIWSHELEAASMVKVGSLRNFYRLVANEDEMSDVVDSR